MKSVAAFCMAAGIWVSVVPARMAQSDEPLRLGGIGDRRSTVCTWVAFSPDGKWLGASARAGEILVWDMTTKRQAARLFKLGDHLFFAFSPDGGQLATISSSGRIRLWDGRQGWDRAKCFELVQPTITREPYPAYLQLVFAPDGKTLAFGSSRGVRIVRASNGEEVGQLRVGGEPRNLQFIQGGRTLVVGAVMFPIKKTAASEVQFWDMGSFTMKAPPLRPGRGTYAFAVSRDEKRLAAPFWEGQRKAILLWDIPAGTGEAIPADHLGHMALSSDGCMLAVAVSPTRNVVLLDLSTRKVQRTLTHPEGSVRSVAFSPDGEYLAVGLHESTEPVCLWQLPSRPNKRQLPGTPSENQPRGRPL